MKHLLLIEQGVPGSRRYMFDCLKERGIRCSLANCLQSTWDADQFDAIYPIRYANWKQTVQVLKAAHKEDPFDGVLCATSQSTSFANRIAHELKLPPISDSCSAWFQYRDQMRMVWEANQLSTPRYQILLERRSFYDLADWNFPLLLKPTAAEGNDGVVKVNFYEELPEKARIPFSVRDDFSVGDNLYFRSELYGAPKSVLAEAYIEGTEYNAEGLVVDGVYHLLGIARKLVEPEPSSREFGYLFPYDQFDPQVKDLIVATLQKAHKALKLRYCFTHTTFKVWNETCYLIELETSLQSDHMLRLLDHALEHRMIDLLADTACGNVPPYLQALLNKKDKRTLFLLFLTPPASAHGAMYQGVDLKTIGQENIVEFQTDLCPGDTVAFSPGSFAPFAGYLIGQASSCEEALQIIEHMRKVVISQYA